MDNKEEILGLPFYPHECGSMIECVTKQDALKAMDIHSKQTAIALMEFMYSRCAETVGNVRPAKWRIDLNTEVTFEELYQAFLNQQ